MSKVDTTDCFEFPTHCPPHRAVLNSHHGPAIRQTASGSSFPGGGVPSYTSGAASGGGNLTISSTTGGADRGSSSSGRAYDHNSYHGSQNELEEEFEDGSTERMEMLVSGLLQEEKREDCGASAADTLRGSINRSSTGYGPSLEDALTIQELRMQYEDLCKIGGYVGAQMDRSYEADKHATSKIISAGGRCLPLTEAVPHYNASFVEDHSHQMLQANESALPVRMHASLLRVGLSGSGDMCNANLSYFSPSQQCGVGSINSNEADHLSSKIISGGRCLPLTEAVAPYNASFVEDIDQNHQMLQANESALPVQASLLQAGPSANGDNCNGNLLSYLSPSQQCRFGSINDNKADHVNSKIISTGRHLPLNEAVARYNSSFVDDQNHQMLQANESALPAHASLLEAGLSANADNCNANLSYFSPSQQCGGVGSTNSNVQMTLTPEEHAYAVQRELDCMALRNREYADTAEFERQVMESRDVMRLRKAHAEYAAELLTIENLRLHERLVSDLQMVADSIVQSAMVERNSAERANDKLVALCKWLYDRGCAISEAELDKVKRDIKEAELDKVKRDIKEASQPRTYVQNLQSTQRYVGPPHGHIPSQPSFGTATSSPNNRFAFAFPTPKTFDNNASAASMVTATPPSPGQNFPCINRSRSLGSTLERKPGRYHVPTASPSKHISSPRNHRSRTVHTTRAADIEMQAKFSTGLHPRTPTSVFGFPSPGTSPPVIQGAAGKANAHKASISGANNESSSIQTSLSDHRYPYASTDRPAIGQQAAENIDGNSTPVRQHDSPTTKAVIAQGVKSISVLLKSEKSASGGRNSSQPRKASSAHGATTVSADSDSLSPIRPRRLDIPKEEGLLQLIPLKHPSVELDVCNQGQFKTELCNNWQETHTCPYGEHCRFAHGVEELRCVLRHPRYKSIPCRMVMNGKACIYGHRCHFRHSLTTEELSPISIIDVHDPAVRGRAMQSVVT